MSQKDQIPAYELAIEALKMTIMILWKRPLCV